MLPAMWDAHALGPVSVVRLCGEVSKHVLFLVKHREKNGSNQSFDFIKDFKSSVKSLCD